MSHRHQLAPTTHTTELQQLQEINRCLSAPGHAAVTAEALGVVGTATVSAASFPVDLFGTARPAGRLLRPGATLHYLTAEGAPEFPYVLGNFRQFGQFGQVGKIGGGPARLAVAHPENSAGLVVELHSDVLRRLSLALGLRHCWGTDAALPTSTRR